MQFELSSDMLLWVLGDEPSFLIAVTTLSACAMLILHDRIHSTRLFQRRTRALDVPQANTHPTTSSRAEKHPDKNDQPVRMRNRRHALSIALRSPGVRRNAILAATLGISILAILLSLGTGISEAIGISCSVGFGFTALIRRGQKARRLKQIEAEFPSAIDTMVRSLRSGLSLSDTFRIIAEEGAPAIALEFRRIEIEREIGLTIPEVMTRFSERVPLQGVKYFVTVVSLQSVTGSSLSDTLDTLGETLRQRRILREKIVSMTADARSSALIIGALPFVVVVALLFLNPAYLGILYETSVGRTLIAASSGYMLIGIFVMREMVKFDE